jgi:hypothetical protein
MNTVSTPASVKHPAASAPEPARSGPTQLVVLVLSWSAVGLPLAWGVAETLRKALALFQ